MPSIFWYLFPKFVTFVHRYDGVILFRIMKKQNNRLVGPNEYDKAQWYVIMKLAELAIDLNDLLTEAGILDLVLALYSDRSLDKYDAKEIGDSIPEIFEELYTLHPDITGDNSLAPHHILWKLAQHSDTPTGTRFTQAEKESVEKLYKEGNSFSEIADQMKSIYNRDYQRGSIWKLLIRLGLYQVTFKSDPRYTNSHKPWTKEEIEIIADRSKSPKELSEILLRSPQVISMRRLLEYGRSPVLWTDEDRLALVEMWQQGISAAEIGASLGRSEYAVFFQVDKLGLRSPKYWTDEQLTELVEMFNNGETQREIAGVLNRPLSSVISKLKDLGLTRGPKPPGWTEDEISKLIRMTNEGKKDKEIAEIMGKTIQAIRQKRSTLFKSGKFDLEG